MPETTDNPNPARGESRDTVVNAEEEYTPIEGYSVIGNLETCAHVSRRGSIDWCCLPAIDSSSVFAGLLDSDNGGHWSVQPTGSFESTQRYVEETNVLETTFTTEDGRATLTDFMPVIGHAYENEPPKRAIYRRISGEEGTVELGVEFAPRPNYARAEPELNTTRAGEVVHRGEDPLALAGLPSPTVADGVARDSVRVSGLC
jgi:alpha,alpha-trehalase